MGRQRTVGERIEQAAFDIVCISSEIERLTGQLRRAKSANPTNINHIESVARAMRFSAEGILKVDLSKNEETNDSDK
jgi:hypothetical protein